MPQQPIITPDQIQSQTYEQKKTNTTLQQSPDPIHYNSNYAFRSQPYRHLNHQNGTIGTFHVRLVEAKGLERSHWSLLGMGVVKHLGLSKAHGEVSSFCCLRLGYRFRSHDDDDDGAGDNNYNNMHENVHDKNAQYNQYSQNDNYNNNNQFNQYNWQNGNIASTIATPTTQKNTMNTPHSTNKKNNDNNNNNNNNNNNIIFTNHNSYRSSTIPSNSNPKWPSVQTNTNKSSFHIPLTKGSMPQDGMEIVLSIQMKEEKSAVDSFVPIGTGGVKDHIGNGYESNDNAFLLGSGCINLTGLVMQGLTSSATQTASKMYHSNSDNGGIVDVYDEWITLTNHDGKQQGNASSSSSSSSNDVDDNKSSSSSSSPSSYGQVRLLISYEPNGLQPQKNDIIAFESFARKSNILSHCPTVIPPLHPLKVKDVKGEYILAEFNLSPVLRSNTNNINNNTFYHTEDDENSYNHERKQMRRQGMIRIHRNSIFVIERTNIVDSAIDISLKPTDILMSTELGRNVSNAAQPYVEAAGDLIAPVLLSSRLLLEAGKVGGGALAIGLKSAVVSVVENSDPERRRKAKRSSSTVYEEYH